jgi:hypothetical protein
VPILASRCHSATRSSGRSGTRPPSPLLGEETSEVDASRQLVATPFLDAAIEAELEEVARMFNLDPKELL